MKSIGNCEQLSAELQVCVCENGRLQGAVGQLEAAVEKVGHRAGHATLHTSFFKRSSIAENNLILIYVLFFKSLVEQIIEFQMI